MNQFKQWFSKLSKGKKRGLITEISMLFFLIILSLLSILTPNIFTINQILGFILGALSILATGLLVERYNDLEEIKTMFPNSDKGLAHIKRRSLHREEKPIEDYFQGASEVKLIAMTGYALFFGVVREKIITALQNGTKFTIIVTDPESSAFVEQHINKIKGGEHPYPLNQIVDMCKNISFANISFRTTDVNLPFMLVMISDKNKKIKHMRVDLYTLNTSDGYRPGFIVTPNMKYPIPKNVLFDGSPRIETLQEFFMQQWKYVEARSKEVYKTPR